MNPRTHFLCELNSATAQQTFWRVLLMKCDLITVFKGIYEQQKKKKNCIQCNLLQTPTGSYSPAYKSAVCARPRIAGPTYLFSAQQSPVTWERYYTQLLCQSFVHSVASSREFLGSRNMTYKLVFYLLMAIGQQSFGKERSAEGLVILPQGSRQVVRQGSNLTITCTYDYQDDAGKKLNNITWILPDALAKNNPVVNYY